MKDLSNKHHIKSLLFDLLFDDEARAQELYDDVRRMHYEKLEQVISRCLDEYAGPGAFAQLSELELDLGEIHYEDLSSELPKRLYETLSQKLSEVFKGVDQKEQPVLRQSVSRIDLIRYYLTEGYLPWNTRSNARVLMEQLLDNDPSSLATLLKSLGHLKNVRQRIIQRFPLPTLQRIIPLLTTADRQQILLLHRLIMTWGKEHLALNFTKSKLEKEIWSFLLDHLLWQAPTTNTIHDLFRAILIRLAERTQRPFDQLFLELSEEVAQNRTGEFTTLKTTLSEVSKVLNITAVREGRKVLKFNDLQIDVRTAILFRYLHTQSIQLRIEDLRPALLQQHFIHLLQAESAPLIEFLRASSKTSIAVKNIIHRFSDRAIEGLIRTIEPSHHKTVISYQNNLLSIHQKERLFSASEKSLSENIWEMILQLLLAKSGSFFNQKAFLQMLIVRMAAHHNIDYGELVGQLYQVIFKVSIDNDQMPLFIQLIKEIYWDERQGASVAREAEEALTKEKEEEQAQSLQTILLEEQRWLMASGIQFIRQYLRKGASTLSKHSLKRLLLEGLKKMPKQVLEALRNPAVFPASVKRLVQDFDQEVIYALVRVLEPVHHQSVFSFQKQIVHLQKKEPLIQASESELSDALWNLILQILLLRPSSHFNQKSFLRDLLLQTAAHYNTDFHILVNQLYQTAFLIQSKSVNLQHFIRLIQEIQQEEEGKIKRLEASLAIARRATEKQKAEAQLRMEQQKNTKAAKLPKQLFYLLIQQPSDWQEQLRLQGFVDPKEAIEHLRSFHAAWLIEELRQCSNTDLQRWMKQLSVETFDALFRQLSTTNSWKVQHLITTLNHRLYELDFSQRVALITTLRHQSFAFLLQYPGRSLRHLLVELVKVFKHYPIPSALFETNGRWQIPAQGNLDDSLRLLEKQIIRAVEIPADQEAEQLVLLQEIIDQAKPQPFVQAAATSDQTEEMEKEIFITNAGLVVLNAYLPFFFQRIDLMEEDDFSSPESAQRAALLLQYIYHPEEEYGEEELVLNKLLCGVPLTEVLPTSFEPTDLEKGTIDEMIKAIIGHWEIIKNSTPQGFRESWLWREGKLTKEEKQWRLIVEKRAFDILLDYIPFSISPIKFSWMDKPIIVDWR